MHHTQNGSALRSGLITTAIIVVALVIAATQLPRGFSDDVSVIGQGTPAVVLVHNKESMLSLNMMTQLNRVRPDYRNDINFLVVDIATEPGRAFVNQHRLDGSIMLVMFDRNGVRRGLVTDIGDEAALRATLNEAFALNVR